MVKILIFSLVLIAVLIMGVQSRPKDWSQKSTEETSGSRQMVPKMLDHLVYNKATRQMEKATVPTKTKYDKEDIEYQNQCRINHLMSLQNQPVDNAPPRKPGRPRGSRDKVPRKSRSELQLDESGRYMELLPSTSQSGIRETQTGNDQVQPMNNAAPSQAATNRESKKRGRPPGSLNKVKGQAAGQMKYDASAGEMVPARSMWHEMRSGSKQQDQPINNPPSAMTFGGHPLYIAQQFGPRPFSSSQSLYNAGQYGPNNAGSLNRIPSDVNESWQSRNQPMRIDPNIQPSPSDRGNFQEALARSPQNDEDYDKLVYGFLNLDHLE